MHFTLFQNFLKFLLIFVGEKTSIFFCYFGSEREKNKPKSRSSVAQFICENKDGPTKAEDDLGQFKIVHQTVKVVVTAQAQ